MKNYSMPAIQLGHLPSTDDYELVIGLVGAVGTELKQVIDLLKERLGLAGYAVELIKISSDVIPILVTEVPAADAKNFNRINDLMNAGNKARENAVEAAKSHSSKIVQNDSDSYGNAVLAYGAAAAIYSFFPPLVRN